MIKQVFFRALLGACIGGAAAPAAQAATYAYVANADSESISVFRLDRAHGTLASVQTVAVGGTVMPLALSPNHHRLYAGVRSVPYRVVSFAVNPIDGRLVDLGHAPLAESMAYLSTDATGRYLFGASYGGKLVSVNPIGADGVAGGPRQTVATGPMAHAIRSGPDNRTVFASVLGDDVWLRFAFDSRTGTLTQDPTPAYRLPPGSGPRHFQFSADGRRTYLIDELDGRLHVLAFDGRRDTAAPVQTLSILPPGFQGKPWGADLHLTPDGRFLYAAERTSSTLAAYRVARGTGTLTRIGTTATPRQPRGFGMDPAGDYLLVAGQLSTRATLYRIDRRSGALRPLGDYPVGANPNWVEIVDFDGTF